MCSTLHSNIDLFAHHIRLFNWTPAMVVLQRQGNDYLSCKKRRKTAMISLSPLLIFEVKLLKGKCMKYAS